MSTQGFIYGVIVATSNTAPLKIATLNTLAIFSNKNSFQMTVESNYAIAIATLSDWLKRLAPVFQPMRSKTKTIRTMYA